MKTVQIPGKVRKPKWSTTKMTRSSQIALTSFAGAYGGSRYESVTYSESEWTMSRRPNRRESSEKAPGPTRKRAAMTESEKAN